MAANPPLCPNLLKVCLEHSWRAFQYHADQRHKTIHFFLVGFAVLVTAYGAVLFGSGDVSPQLRNLIAAVVSALGAFYALTFLALDKRNEQLVHADEMALKASEWLLSTKIGKTAEGSSNVSQLQGDRGSTISHLATLNIPGHPFNNVSCAYEIVLATDILANSPQVRAGALPRLYASMFRSVGFHTFGRILEKYYTALFALCLVGAIWHFYRAFS